MAEIQVIADVSQLEAFAARAAAAAGVAEAASIKVVADITNKVAQDARSLVPVLTGALKGSITPHVAGLFGEVTADIRYAEYVEFGTYKDTPQPFMMPALEANEDPFATELLAVVGDAIEAAL